MKNGTIAALLVVAILVSAGAGYFIGVKSAPNTSSFNTTFTTYFHYQISVNYSGPWNLVYWGENGTVPQNSSTIPGRNPSYVPWQYNVKGNLTGSGNYETTITTYGVGYVENMLCAQATKLGSQNLTLTLAIVGKTNSTTDSKPSAEVCVTFAV
jgi:hypothetical protein